MKVLKDKEEKERDCIHCGWAMGEREGEPLCGHCGGEFDPLKGTLSKQNMIITR